jgi:hypothetical protein
MGNIKFEGDPPYTLPMAQTVTARPGRKTVEVILEVIAPGKVPSSFPLKYRWHRIPLVPYRLNCSRR